MRAKTILSFLFLTSLCVVVVLGFRALPGRLDADTPAAKQEVLVATAELPPGTLLRAKDVAWQPTDGTAEPGRIVRPYGTVNGSNPALDQQARSEIYGAALRTGLRAGQPIRHGIIVKPGDHDFLQAVLSPRARAITIPLATSGAGTGLLYPGDRVDVILTQSFKNDPLPTRRSVSETVVEGLRVLAIDAPDAKQSGAANGLGRTVTLEVTARQAEKINVAAELGKLTLILRSAAQQVADAAAASPGPSETNEIKPVWAGDVSPALSDAAPKKVIAPDRPVVDVIRGTKTVSVKAQ